MLEWIEDFMIEISVIRSFMFSLLMGICFTATFWPVLVLVARKTSPAALEGESVREEGGRRREEGGREVVIRNFMFSLLMGICFTAQSWCWWRGRLLRRL
jgi:hypothetical protein